MSADIEVAEKAERFADLYEEARRLERAYRTLRDRAEADPACPPLHCGRDWSDRSAFLEAHGVWAACDKWNEAHEVVGKTVRDLFRTPARTPAGILIKLRVLRMAVGPFSESDGYEHDDNLLSTQRVYDDSEATVEECDFLAAVIGDLERMRA